MKFPKIWPCEYLGYLMTDWKELKKNHAAYIQGGPKIKSLSRISIKSY